MKVLFSQFVPIMSSDNEEDSETSFDLETLCNFDINELLDDMERRAEERERQMGHLERVQRRIRFADIYDRVYGGGNRTREGDSGLGSTMRNSEASSTRQDLDAESTGAQASILRSGQRKAGDKRRNSKHVDQMSGLVGKQTSNSPQATRTVRPIYTYAR